ncbi:uncharacterized protein Dyak_GE23003 [Drosophila yakuba]|uniref:Uncharacterized protein n=1 Tax=Drosophila yakuba TaxID=7245 RepID=B4IT99_DROYA|nr:uncharacterized protein Dyak_GE23003 [Drosophila yakuba]
MATERWAANSQSTRTVVAPTELSTTELNLQRLQRSTSASAIRSHLTKVSSTYRRPIAFNFIRRECKRFYVLPVYMPSRFQHSTKQSIRLWWQYAYKCVTPSASAGAVWNPNLKFRLYCSRQLRIRKLRRGPWSRRQPLKLHINDIKLLCQVRRRSK